MKVLLTGICGFVGSHIVEHIQEGAVDISDVPTVREMLEMQAASRQAKPGG